MMLMEALSITCSAWMRRLRLMYFNVPDSHTTSTLFIFTKTLAFIPIRFKYQQTWQNKYPCTCKIGQYSKVTFNADITGRYTTWNSSVSSSTTCPDLSSSFYEPSPPSLSPNFVATPASSSLPRTIQPTWWSKCPTSLPRVAPHKESTVFSRLALLRIT